MIDYHWLSLTLPKMINDDSRWFNHNHPISDCNWLFRPLIYLCARPGPAAAVAKMPWATRIRRGAVWASRGFSLKMRVFFMGFQWETGWKITMFMGKSAFWWDLNGKMVGKSMENHHVHGQRMFFWGENKWIGSRQIGMGFQWKNCWKSPFE